MRFIILVCLLLPFCYFPNALLAQEPYPFTSKYITLDIEQQAVKMAYMDTIPAKPNGHAVIMFHGKNFNGYYWKDVANHLLQKGYRVIIPDQVGWGKSDKPNIHYSFHLLAANSRQLLDSLHVSSVCVIGHSIGGMLAARFALMYPKLVEQLVLEDPIGLEDYKTFVPYTSVDEQFKTECAATYGSLKKYMLTYFPEWKPEYEELVRQQAVALNDPAFKQVAWANALTYQMIYEQPVCYEFKNIKCKTLLITGLEDHTIVGKDRLSKGEVSKHGQYPALGKKTHALIKDSKLVELPGVGHIPHIQQPGNFFSVLDPFLAHQ